MSRVIARARPEDFQEISAAAGPLLFDGRFVSALARATGYLDNSLVIQDGSARYLLPLLRRRVLGVPFDLSLPFGLHGSLFPPPPDPGTFRDLLEAARRHLRGNLVAQNCAETSAAHLPAVALHTTHLLRTGGASYDHLFAKTFDAKLRNQIRKAEKSGIAVERGNDAAAIDAFYRLYLMSNERWGRSRPKYSRAFFDPFAGLPCFEVRLALHEGRPIAANLVLEFRDQHLYWFGAMDKAKGNLCPNHLLISEALKEAIAARAGSFNFGVSGRLLSVRKFKESFGAEPCTYPTHFLGNPLARAALRYRMRDA